MNRVEQTIAALTIAGISLASANVQASEDADALYPYKPGKANYDMDEAIAACRQGKLAEIKAELRRAGIDLGERGCEEVIGWMEANSSPIACSDYTKGGPLENVHRYKYGDFSGYTDRECYKGEMLQVINIPQDEIHFAVSRVCGNFIDEPHASIPSRQRQSESLWKQIKLEDKRPFICPAAEMSEGTVRWRGSGIGVDGGAQVFSGQAVDSGKISSCRIPVTD